MDNLVDSTKEQKMNVNVIAYLRTIINDNNYVPYKFFSLFELGRLEFEDSTIK